MKVSQKKPLLTFQIKFDKNNQSFIEIDVRKKMINMTLFQRIESLGNELNKILYNSQYSKCQIAKTKDSIYVCYELFTQIIRKLSDKIKKYVIMQQILINIKKEVDNRSLFLDREEQKRNKSLEIKNNIKYLDKQKDANRLKKKFKYLLKSNYQIRDTESFTDLYDRVQSHNNYLTKYISSVYQINFDKLKNKYRPQYQRLTRMKGMSIPSKSHLPPNITSLYIVRTDIEINMQGKTYNVVKVGKTNQSIFDYQKNLYEDYKHKILFQYVYLGIFQQEKGTVIDYYFHQRLTKIPQSKYFIFNYRNYQQDIRVSQEFYIMTEQFIMYIEKLLEEYCKSHRNHTDVKYIEYVW